MDLRDLPRELKSRFLKIDGDGKQQWALRIYPRENIWNGPELDRFVRELRTVDAGVTGAPIQVYESAGRMDVTWASIGLYALSVIFMILLFNYLRPGQKLLTIVPPIGVAAFIGYTLYQRNGSVDTSLAVMICVGLAAFIAAVLDFRNLRDTVLTLLPALAGGTVLLGMLQLLGLQLNPMSLMALPLVFAIGFVALWATPMLWVVIAFQAAQRAANFAISNPAREVLFTVVDREEKYKAKNVIDNVVFRGSDALFGWLFTALRGLGMEAGAISLATVPLTAAWLALALALGRMQEKRSPAAADDKS